MTGSLINASRLTSSGVTSGDGFGGQPQPDWTAFGVNMHTAEIAALNRCGAAKTQSHS